MMKLVKHKNGFFIHNRKETKEDILKEISEHLDKQ